ncbi:helix-hairpin-helix domain-containing protein [Fodinibius sp. Rm-B-1B1-1]|uniref:ComEA family DNA-binding protein n=1 Tax=Fodinibius alkaliphilus TaxID=3140241 RepID=UPI00315A61CC
MKRTLFFWLEKLKIAPGERKTITALLILLVALGVLNLALSSSVPFDGDEYRELEEQFAERTALINAEEEKLLEQYYPSDKSVVKRTVVDTVEKDSTSNERNGSQEERTAKASSGDKINVNTANEQALKTLPGIGPTYAKRIVTYRQEHGRFESFSELKKIKGIAQKRLDKLMPFIKLKDSN